MAARRLGQILVDLGYLTEDQLWDVLEEQKQSPGEIIGQVAIRMGLVTEEQVTEAFAEQWGMHGRQPARKPTFPPRCWNWSRKRWPDLQNHAGLAERRRPDGGHGRPAKRGGLDDLRNFLGYDVRGAVSNLAGRRRRRSNRYYADKQDSIEDVIGELEEDYEEATGGRRFRPRRRWRNRPDAGPIRKLLNMVMLLAIKDQASDIHFEPFEDEFKIRVRADGVLV